MKFKHNWTRSVSLAPILALIALLGCSGLAQAAEPPVLTTFGVLCGEVPLPKRPLKYCFEDRAGHAKSPASTVPVIYYFHGLGGSVEDLFEGENRYLLDALAKMYGADLPIIVSLSLGNEGVMGDEAREISVAALPQLDNFIAPGKSFRRTLMGGSMGGHNVLRLGAERSSIKFQAIAALCPAIGTFDGHNQSEVDAYIQRHEPLLDRRFFEKALVAYKRELPSTQIWTRNNSLNLIASGAYREIPIYLSTGIEDQLGFIEGARAFRDKAASYETVVDYHEVRGPHCVFDLSALLRFLRANT